ncbi:MAG: hypothetical protein J5534_07165 [Fibrobacter sp.]|nr:hypothetical protein [Fibrobacter sp.]
MKQIILACLIVCGFSFAQIPGVCDVGDAKKERFDKPVEYELMKECMNGSYGTQGISDYKNKLEYCSCLIGAFHCYFHSIEKLNEGDEKKLEKANNLAKKCYDKSK